MKKTISLIATLLFSLAGAFALKLPDGTNVRAKEVTTYESGALRSVDVGSRYDPGVEIATPIGKMLVWGKICYYEDGAVKSVTPCLYSELNKAVTVQTNFGALTFSDYGAKRITFYQSGALWHIDGGGQIPYEEGRVLPFEEKGQVTDCAYNYDASNDSSMIQPAQKPMLAMYYPNGAAHAQTAVYTGKIRKWSDDQPLFLFCHGDFLFYDSGRSDYAIVRRADMQGYLTFKTKAGEFRASSFEFYRDGTIWNGYIMLQDQKNGTVKTSLGDIFCGGNRISLWQDGSIRECRTDEVMMETIYGKKVQIPENGRLAFRKDGSVRAYTTILKTEYARGSHTYIVNDRKYIGGGDTVWFDENNEFAGTYEIGWQSFYPSGALWKDGGSSWNSEDGKNSAGIGKFGVLEYKIFGKNVRHNYYDERTEQWCNLSCAKLPVSDRVRNIYFGADGKPESYDCYKTVQNLSLTWTHIDGEPTDNHYGYTSDDKLEEYGDINFMEVDDDGNYIPDETRHPITLKEVR